MRPTLNVLSDEQTTNILNEAKRIMAEVGMNIRGAEMKKRLLDHGLKADESGERIFFPADVVEKAIADRRQQRSLRTGIEWTQNS